MRFNITIFTVLIPVAVLAHSGYTGYSGAPGSNGTCSASCHAQYSFPPRVSITGFPEDYELGHQYTIYISEQNGHSISQFNASVRVGVSSEIAGELGEDYATEVYSIDNELDGVHWQTTDTDSGAFIWTAPSEDAGEVRLYWAGLQGNRAFGADTQIVLVSHGPTSNIEYQPGYPRQFSMKQNYPNPFNNHTIIEIAIAEEGEINFIITNILGQLVYEWKDNAAGTGTVSIRWDGTGQDGIELPSGVYFYRLTSKAGNTTKKMMLLR